VWIDRPTFKTKETALELLAFIILGIFMGIIACSMAFLEEILSDNVVNTLDGMI
jgi:hypothetical protein